MLLIAQIKSPNAALQPVVLFCAGQELPLSGCSYTAPRNIWCKEKLLGSAVGNFTSSSFCFWCLKQERPWTMGRFDRKTRQNWCSCSHHLWQLLGAALAQRFCATGALGAQFLCVSFVPLEFFKEIMVSIKIRGLMRSYPTCFSWKSNLKNCNLLIKGNGRASLQVFAVEVHTMYSKGWGKKISLVTWGQSPFCHSKYLPRQRVAQTLLTGSFRQGFISIV